MINTLCKTLNDIRIKSPLVHNITNFVTVNDCANILLAIGASPIMTDDPEDACEITAISSALVINIGTLNERSIKSMFESAKVANVNNIPVILDPVGAGASQRRNTTIMKLLNEFKIDIIRGNVSEIGFIAGKTVKTKGVDVSIADRSSELASITDIVQTVANKFNCTVAATGKTDVIANSSDILYLHNGHEMMRNVTGTGCMCTALIGAAAGTGVSHFIATATAVALTGIAGEIAFEKAGDSGTSSFRTAFIDTISIIGDTLFKKHIKMGN